MELVSECPAEPADRTICDACAAYIIVQEKTKDVCDACAEDHITLDKSDPEPEKHVVIDSLSELWTDAIERIVTAAHGHNPLFDGVQLLLGYPTDIDISILVDPQRMHQYRTQLVHWGEVRLPNDLHIDRLAFFDHDYEWHMLAQVWDHALPHEDQKWRCVLLYGDSGGVEIVYEWRDWTWGEPPYTQVAEYVESIYNTDKETQT